MKMKFLLAASALLLCLACAREELGTDDRIAGGSNNASEMIFSAVSPSTKTMMGESVEGKRPVYWSEGDKICVNGVVSDPLEGVSENATAVVFRVGSGLDAPFKGLYPASFYTDASTITLPSVQTWENGSFANGSFPMASYTQDQREEMAFRFLCSMLKLSIKQDSSQSVEADEIASVVFRGNDGEQVSGAFTIDYQNATLSSVSSSDNDKIVGMIVNQPLSADKALDIYLVVPANVYASGFTLSITDAQGRVMKKASNKSQTLKAGIIAKLPEFVFVPNAEGGDDPIPEDLIPKDGDVTEDGEPVVMYFGARIDNGEGDKEGTKTHLGTPSAGKYPNLWTIGDKVAINGIASASLPEANIGYDEEEHASTARFPMAQHVDKCAGYYYVGYPYTDGTTSGFTGFSDGTGTVIIPTEQAYTAGTYDPRAFVLIGKSTSQVMSFTPLVAPFRITPRDEASPTGKKVKSVTLTAIGGEAMSGTFTTNYISSSLTATSGNSSVTISVADASGVAFGYPFFFMIPARTYASGFRVTITTVDGKSMSFSNTASYDATVGTARNLTAPAFVESKVGEDLACVYKTSSSAAFQWSGSNSSNNIKKPWRLAIYTNSACTSLQVAYNIPADPSAEGVWKDQGGTPSFIVGGLAPGTDYWCKVTDVNNAVSSEPLKFTTDAFTLVAPSSTVGSVLLAENFGEFGHGSATLRGTDGLHFGGWAPRSTSAANNSIDCAAPTDEVTSGAYLAHDGLLRVVEGFDFTTAPRFYEAGWGFTADALDAEGGDETVPSVYAQPGAMRFGKSNGHRIFLVLPALTGITSGKYATVDVTIKASRTVARDISQNNQLAVFLEDDLSMTNTTRRLYGTPSLTRAYPITMTQYGHNSEVKTVRIDGVQNTDHLLIGAYTNVNERNRFQIYSVIVTKVSESDVETFDITDDVSLRNFYARVDDGEKSLNAKVLADVTASSTTADDWTPLGTPNDPEAESSPYTGTFEGNDKTITGLTKPFFADLQGTVQNLTLNSTVSSTDRALHFDALAIFAEKLTGGTLSSCTSAGSVTYTPSEAIANGTRLVAGIVGQAASGTISGCINNATLSVPAGSVSGHDAIIEVGGIVARLGESNTSNASCSNSTNTGSISVGIDGSGSHNWATRIGGVIGYVINRKSSAPVLNTLANKGAVQYSGICGGQLSVGGVVGYMYENSSNSTHTNSTLSGCTNHASVTVTSEARVATQNDINVAGIAAVLSNAMSDCNNHGNISNSGTFSGTKSDICIGGIAGNSKGYGAISNCHNYNSGSLVAGNTGTVQNAGAGNIIAIGGLAGWSNGGTSYTSACSNAGSVSNSGQGYDTTAGVRIGGLIGFANGENDLSGGNYNQGTVTEQSSTATSYVAVGGVCGFADDASTTLASAQNKSGGTVTLSLANKTISLGRVGGVLGYASESCTLSGASNAAPIDVKTTTTSDTLYVGGLLGYGLKSCTMAGISNSGKLTIQNQLCISLYAGGLVGFNKGSITGSSSNAVGGQIAISSLSSSDASYIGGLVGYTSGSITGTSGTKIENNGSITTGGSVANHLYLGGITGYNKAALSYCTNKGAINNSIKTNVTGGKDINIGGVSGLVNAALSNCSNSVAVVNTSSGDSKVDICIGGVIGNNKGYTMTSCSNTGSVSNAGDGGILAVGGLAGWSGASSTYASACSNSGAISNSGLASNSTAGVRMGGLVGCINGTNNLTGTSVSYNYNGGPVTESSASRVVYVGGVAGHVNNTGSQMNYARNLDTGDITIENNLRTRVGVGGIVGYAFHIFNFNYTNNAGDINFSNLTISSQVFCGGILGAFNDDSGTTKNAALSITGCVNSGHILCPDADNGGNMGAYATTTTSYSYIGGISGVGNVFNKTFTNCNNSGNITVYNNLKTRVGGCLAYANVNPTGCSCSGNIKYFKYNNPANDGKGQVGGVIAYINVSTISDLTYSGTSINSRGSTKACFTGGIVGQIGPGGSGEGKVTTFSNCKVSGTISGAGTGFNESGPGIFAARDNKDADDNTITTWNFSFPDCVVKTGTKMSTKSAVTITADNVDTWVIGRYAPTSIDESPTVGNWN